MDRIGVVVPSNRPESLAKWKEDWKKDIEEAEARLYIVEDTQETWTSIKSDLGKHAWIIPVRTDCIRSYGYLQALRDGCDYILTFDDDVRPQLTNPILEHVTHLNSYVEPDNWTRTLRQGSPTRGLPQLRRVVLNHGLWDGIPDVSAKVQINGFIPYVFSDPNNEQIIPKNQLYPMSGMNLGWIASLTPVMYFGLQGYNIHRPEEAWGLHRCGDILAGVMSKILIDQMSSVAAVHSGSPFVWHDRASDPLKNLELERIGEHASFVFGEYLKGSTSYLTMAERLFHLDYPNKTYCRNLGKAMRIWQEVTKKG